MQSMTNAGAGIMGGVASIILAPSIASLGLFEFVWIIGMAAMMFAAMIPTVLFYNKLVTKVEPNPSIAKVVGTPLFLMGYLAVYGGLGLVAYLAIIATLTIGPLLPDAAAIAWAATGLTLIVAGVYQFSPLKYKCLSNCVSPLGFFTLYSRRGLRGSFRMGLRHGIFCVGCCWAYMFVMLAVAAMSLPFMVVLSLVIILEKVIIRGAVWFNRLVALGFIALGLLALYLPGLIF